MPMALARGASNFFLKKFMRSVSSWGTITYSHTIFFTTISASTTPIITIASFPLISCVQSIFFLKKLYDDLCIELRNHHVIHTIYFSTIFTSTTPF
uniref:Putative ovule protein n=2 Tax=Solanum chacoense TaxID=4108 RepID=A0A0V0HCG5_SOLCH